jgi:hypothetical protein
MRDTILYVPTTDCCAKLGPEINKPMMKANVSRFMFRSFAMRASGLRTSPRAV